MERMDNKIISILLLLTILGEFVLPWILQHFYKGYDSKTTVMSALGSPESPVSFFYNAWLIWLGTYLLFISLVFFKGIYAVSHTLAVLTSISIAVFAIGAGILAGSFSVNESKETVTTASKIHGAGAAIGFMALLFFPLLQSITAFMSGDMLQCILCAVSFILAMVFFVFFIMGDKDNVKGTVFSFEGLWERLSLFFMYVPFLYIAIVDLFVIS